MRRMKKFQKEKAEIEKRLEKLQERIESSEDSDEIITALEDYQIKLEETMKLKKADFDGEAAEDFKYGFKMPLKCLNDTNCEWICQKMVKADGIADEAVNSTQNVNEADIEESAGFETDIIPDEPVDDYVDEADNVTRMLDER